MFDANGAFVADRDPGVGLFAVGVTVDAHLMIYATVFDGSILRVAKIDRTATRRGTSRTKRRRRSAWDLGRIMGTTGSRRSPRPRPPRFVYPAQLRTWARAR